ncbi:MAG: M48 family metalloprotease [Notoacmeibacter sp.]
MFRVNGFYGHVKRNDFLSVLLFIGFLAAFHIVVGGLLALPLLLIDMKLSPIFDPFNYFRVLGLPLTIIASLWFWVSFSSHIEQVKLRTGFNLVSATQNPRLHRILGPLALTAGIPLPATAIVDTQARNAFACGMTRKNAVIVVTRGLLNALSDDELEAVLAHEVAHISTDDTRLLAAANIMLSSILTIQRRNPFQLKSGKRIIIFILIPALLILSLIMTMIIQSGLTLGKISRLAIASSREYIADAEAVRLTHKPAALISALRKIEGLSAIDDLDPTIEAMMIDGATTGEFATHPTIAERIAVLLQHGGAMAREALINEPTPANSKSNLIDLPEFTVPAFNRHNRTADFIENPSRDAAISISALRAMGARASEAQPQKALSAPSPFARAFDYFKKVPTPVEKMSLASRVQDGSGRDIFGLTKKIRYSILGFLLVSQAFSLITFYNADHNLSEISSRSETQEKGIVAPLRPVHKTVESQIRR